MLKSYLKIAIRNLLRYKVYSLINVLGLGLGMACAILISLWVIEQLSYDRFHQNGDRIYRVNTRLDEDRIAINSSWRLGPALKEKYPEILDFTRVRFRYGSLVKYEDKNFSESRIYLADPAFFRIFTFPFIQGNPETALQDLNSIVITESTAKRYFGDDDPMGKILHLAREGSDFVVSGVVEDVPLRSHINFDLVARIELMGQQRLESWEFTGPTYVLISADVSRQTVSRKLVDFYREEVDAELKWEPILQSMTDIHLYKLGKPGIIRQVYIFSFVGILILIIACINFINLSTARSTRRAKEVGVRKVTGASRLHLVKQFLGESVLMSVIALGFALALVELILPGFNTLTGESLSLSLRSYTPVIIVILALTPITGIIAGYFPALLLSAFQPAQVLKEQRLGLRGSTLRRVLILFQFSISIGLIVCTTVVYRQLNFIETKDIGYDRDNLVAVPNNLDLMKRFDTFKEALLKDGSIVNVTSAAMSSAEIGEVIEIDWEGNPSEDFLPIGYTMVDYDFFETLGMQLLQGRSFSKDFKTDLAEACVINESALTAMELESPIGTEVYFNHPALEEDYRRVKIIGVVKDFHYRSFFDPVGPFIFRMHRPWHFGIFVRIQAGEVQKALAHLEITFQQFSPDYSFRYQFVDEAYQQLYISEVRLGQLFNTFGILAVLISCMGLFGLTLFTVEQKTKEIGVRKVLGATVSSIVVLLSKDIAGLVGLANVIAWPIAFYTMNNWLQNFVYRTDISWWIFPLAGAVALIVALLTVSYQAIKAAVSDPVKSLRYE